jgi:hypothetical protein
MIPAAPDGAIDRRRYCVRARRARSWARRIIAS